MNIISKVCNVHIIIIVIIIIVISHGMLSNSRSLSRSAIAARSDNQLYLRLPHQGSIITATLP